MRKSCILILIGLFLFPLCLGAEVADIKKEVPLTNLLEEITLVVSKARGLSFKAPVKHGVKTKTELRDYLQKLLREEVPQEKLRAYQKALVKFGLIPADLDLESFLLELYTEQVAGFYDWRTKSLYLIGDTPAELLKIIVAHELTHALQDQYVGIENLPSIKEKNNDDRLLATQALLEGDAMSVMVDYVLIPTGQDSTALPDLSPFIRDFVGLMGGQLMAKAPPYFQYNMLFPYLNGLTFIQQLRQSGGWDMVDRALKEPPMSTEQVLHPEKYLVQRDPPTFVSLPSLSRELGPGWVYLDKNALGEFNTAFLLQSASGGPGGESQELARGWDGDLYQVYEEQSSGKVALVWFTTWDSPKDAQKFFKDYSALLVKKYGVRATASEAQHLLFYHQGEAIYIEWRGLDVLVLEGVPQGSLDPVRNSAWQVTKTERP